MQRARADGSTRSDGSLVAAPLPSVRAADTRHLEAPVNVQRLDLRALFETQYASVWRLLRRFGVPVAQLDDAAQEVFWVAARRLADIAPGRERAFLYGVAMRVASNMVREGRALPPLVDVDECPHVSDERPSPEEQLDEQRARELLDVVLDRMAADLRVVFVLFELEGLEVREIAELEGVPIGTASSRLRRAREEFSALAKRARAQLSGRGRSR
jgi:RNA polymerase sigma-70 factor, ECF subfamily